MNKLNNIEKAENQAAVSVSAGLSGKSKHDFLDYYWKNYIGKTRFLNQKSETEEFFNSLYKTFQNALIIDFFDTVNLQITIEAIQGGEFRTYVLDRKFSYLWIDDRFEDRDKAISKIIEKANEIYNTEAEH